jgi:UDP-glucose 4-epimerase
MMSSVLVTGGAGYIGSHACAELVAHGHEVVVLDNLAYGHRDIADKLGVTFVEGDTRDREMLADLFASREIDAVMHFAAFAYVGESVEHPSKYYWNNVVGTLGLLDEMIAAGVHHLIFSSTCATYGVPTATPITEDQRQAPINPYGSSKLMVERILADYGKAYGLKSVIFRYFNAAGAAIDRRIGEDHNPETHLIPLVLEAALGRRPSISVFGTDYDTPDGTCVRDYIHVCDLASAHRLGLDHLLGGGESDVFNLGNGRGFSVNEIIESARRVTGRRIEVVAESRREGDPAALVGSADKARRVLGWVPSHAEIDTIVTSAWKWHLDRHGGAT